MTGAAPLAESLRAALGERVVELQEFRGEITVEVRASQWHECARILRDDKALAFEQLIDLCAVDYLGYGQSEWDTEDVTAEGFSRGVEAAIAPGRFDWEERPQVTMERRFAVVIHLLSVTHNHRVRAKCFPDQGELPMVATLVDIWSAANWYEREAFDLYGVLFEGHPDLRRILTDYGFVGHPFRKDFPLIGNVEMRYDPEKQRVVYEPVSIEPRVLVPRTVREDSRYVVGDDAPAADD